MSLTLKWYCRGCRKDVTHTAEEAKALWTICGDMGWVIITCPTCKETISYTKGKDVRFDALEHRLMSTVIDPPKAG